MVKGKKGATKKGANKKVATPKVEEPVVDETAAWEEEEATQETTEETVDDVKEEAENEEEEEEEEEEAEAEVEAENEEEEETVEETKEENEEMENEEEAEDAENEDEEADENEDADNKKKDTKPNNYVTTHPDEFSSQIMKDIKNDFNTANRRGRHNHKQKDMVRIRQKRAQLSLDTILVYGEREYRNCSSVPLMSLSFALRETIQKYRKSIGMGRRDEVCPEKLHHIIVKVDSELGLNGLRAVIKWMHTGDLNLTADNFEEIVAVVLYFKIKMLRQSLIRLGRKVGIKFVPVPANEKTIERRKREGKPTLPDGLEEAEKLEDGEEPLPEDAKVVEGKDVLAKVKNMNKIQYLKEIPKSEAAQRKEVEKQIRIEKAQAKKEANAKKQQQQNRKRSNTDNKNNDSGEAKKGKMNDGVKKEGGMKGERRNNTSGGARGGRATSSRGSFTNTRGGARGGSHSGGKSIYREHSQQAQTPSYQPPQPNYYQAPYQAPPAAYGYQQPPQYQQPYPQQPYQSQYQQPGQQAPYYGNGYRR